MESFKLLIFFLVFGTVYATNVAPNNLPAALVWSASGDTNLNVSKGVMYYNGGGPLIVNTKRMQHFTGYGIDRLAYDYENRTIYFHSTRDYVTYEIFKEDPSSPHSYDRYTGPAGGLAYDWLAKNLYYTDITYKWVWLFTTRGPRQPKMIIPKTSDRVPFAIAVSPLKSWLFISDIGKEPKIERASLSGDNLKSIISLPGGKVTSLTIDEGKSRLFWAEHASGRIGHSDLSGKDKKYFTASPGVVSIAVFLGSHVFALNNKTNSVSAYSPTGTKYMGEQIPGMTGAKDIIAYAANTQPGQSSKSPCLKKGCAQICVGDGGSGKCMCFEGYSRGSDGKSCSLDLPLIVWSKGNSLCRFNPNDTSTGHHCYLGFYEEKDILALTFDARAREIFYANSAGYINAYPTRDFKGAKVTPLIQTEGNITALAYDWTESNIYWLDVKRNEIAMAPKTGKGQKSIIRGLEEVSSIALEPLEGYLFWSRRKPTPAIMRAKMDGTGATEFITTNVTDPRGMAINYKQKRFYWIETGLPVGYAFYSVDLNGGDRKLEGSVPLDANINKLAVDENRVYFSMVDGQYAGLHSVIFGKKGTIYFGSKRVHDIIAYDLSVQPPKGPKSTGGMGPRGNHSLVVLIVLAISLQFTSST